MIAAMSDLKPLSSRRLWLLLAAAFGTFSMGAAFMHAYTVFLVDLHRGVRLDPGGGLDRLFGVADRQRRQLAAGRLAGGPAGAARG